MAKSKKRTKTAAASAHAKATTHKPKVKPAKAREAMFKKIAFTMFAVDDSTRARAFYEGTLGFKRGLASPSGTWTEYDLPGGGCLALFKHPDPAHARKAGGASVAFEVADLDALVPRLREAGVAFQGGEIKGPHCRMWNITDTEGNGIILHQLDAK